MLWKQKELLPNLYLLSMVSLHREFHHKIHHIPFQLIFLFDNLFLFTFIKLYTGRMKSFTKKEKKLVCCIIAFPTLFLFLPSTVNNLK